MKKIEGKVKTEKEIKLVGTEKKINPRGKVFEGTIIKKFQKRVVIQFERTIYVKKYERYSKSRTRIHARLPENMTEKVGVGDLIRVRECRPLSKIIHFIVIDVIKKHEGEKK